mgnify:CR=1 FL=1
MVGDGDFSFSLAFAKRYNVDLVCSTIESADVMTSKYPSYTETVRSLQKIGKSYILYNSFIYLDEGKPSDQALAVVHHRSQNACGHRTLL